MTNSRRYLLALGGNLPTDSGSPAQTIADAIEALNFGPVRVVAASRLFETPCFPPGAGPDYVNAAVGVDTELDPGALLAHLHDIEARWGRERMQRWGMRTLDVDLIACGNLVLPSAEIQASWRALSPEEQVSKTPETLILPHPRLQDRAFVLVPLHDVAPDWVHPLLNKSVTELLAALSPEERAEVKPL